jgi:ABC-type transport system involved in multi-copper enzyme maturation permease subunit
MGDLVLSELRKIRSTRLWWALLAGAVLYTAIQAGADAAIAGSTPGGGQPTTPGLDTPEAIRNVYVGAMFQGTYIFAMILGITGMTGEYRYQTITPTFLAEPRRARVVVAKMGAHLLTGLVYGVVGLVTAVAVGATVIAIRGFDLGFGADRLFPTMLLGVVAVALWTVLGIGIGTLIRNQIAAILIAVFITFLVEPLLTFILGRGDLDYLVTWLPTNASTALMAPGGALVHYLEWWAGGLVLIGYALVLAALGISLSVRRDIS